jgi:hypothetical protein
MENIAILPNEEEAERHGPRADGQEYDDLRKDLKQLTSDWCPRRGRR